MNRPLSRLRQVPGVSKVAGQVGMAQRQLAQIRGSLQDLQPASIDTLLWDSAATLEALEHIIRVQHQLGLDVERYAGEVRTLTQSVVLLTQSVFEEFPRRVDNANAQLLRDLESRVTSPTFGLVEDASRVDQRPIDLLTRLAPFLHGDVAIDVGANSGTWSLQLRSAGLRVISVEPNPLFADDLRSLFADDFVSAALGSAERKVPLYILAEDAFEGDRSLLATTAEHHRVGIHMLYTGPTVELRRLDSLARQLGVIDQVAVLAIDAPASVGDILVGLGVLKPEVIATTFLGVNHPFNNSHADPDLIVEQMLSFGYRRWIVVDRLGRPIANRRPDLNSAEATLLFFRDRDGFRDAWRLMSAAR
jgi:FkbM family methyltransferase